MSNIYNKLFNARRSNIKIEKKRKFIMNEILEKLELKEAEKEKALRECEKIIHSWGLNLLHVRPSPLHFGLQDFYNIGHTEFEIVNNIEEGYCSKFIFMFKGQTCPLHYHEKKHETFFIVKGKIEMEIENERVIMYQGDKMSMSQGTKHRFTALEDTLILESSKEAFVEDSIFVNEKINEVIFGT